MLKSIGRVRFPALTDADWLWQARALWTTRDGRLAPAFDPALARTMDALNFDEPLPALWPQFDGLAHVPIMVIRGEHSDIISPETVAAMAVRRPDLEVFEVKGQGHAPLLTDQASIDRITAFADRCDGQGMI
jgi:pimeloyl-ACP methyl ester carboxylesterase